MGREEKKYCKLLSLPTKFWSYGKLTILPKSGFISNHYLSELAIIKGGGGGGGVRWWGGGGEEGIQPIVTGTLTQNNAEVMCVLLLTRLNTPKRTVIFTWYCSHPIAGQLSTNAQRVTPSSYVAISQRQLYNQSITASWGSGWAQRPTPQQHLL